MIRRLIIVILLLGLVFGGIYVLKQKQQREMQALLSRPRPPATVATARVRLEYWRPGLRAVGSLTAVSGIDITTEVAGLVRKLRFESGQRVSKGDVILQLDDQVDRATLAGLKADRRLAEIQFQRTRELLPRKAVSQSDFDAARARFDSAQARLAEQQARIRLKTIRAPFAGLLGIRAVDVGEYLSPGARIVSLTALDPIYLDYALPERQYRQLALGQEVQARIDAWPGEIFRGRVTAIDTGLQQGSRTIRVRATLANPGQRLRPGMFAEVVTLQANKQERLTVPRTAISFNTYGDFVFVIRRDGERLRVQRRQVETGAVRAGRVVIRTGLSVDEQVVRSGLVKLRDGMPVRIDDSVNLDDARIEHE